MNFKNDKKLILALLFYVLIDILSRLIYNFHILNENILINHYYNEFASSVAEEKLKHFGDNMAIRLLISELFVIANFFLITSIIKTGAILLDFTNIAFKKILFVVVISYYVFLIPGIVQIIWFSFFVESYTVESLTNFNWHTLLYWIKDLNYDFLKYPLSVINLYELFFWISLTLLLKRKGEISFWNSLKLVSYTYGLGLFIWVVFVVFMLVTVS